MEAKLKHQIDKSNTTQYLINFQKDIDNFQNFFLKDKEKQSELCLTPIQSPPQKPYKFFQTKNEIYEDNNTETLSFKSNSEKCFQTNKSKAYQQIVRQKLQSLYNINDQNFDVFRIRRIHSEDTSNFQQDKQIIQKEKKVQKKKLYNSEIFALKNRHIKFWAKDSCTCKKSQCLKLYCQCFSKGDKCLSSCTCQSCCNNDQHNSQREQAIQNILSSNSLAFQPKQQSQLISCSCSKSNCLKNYCECYNLNKECSSTCKCNNCLNKKINLTIQTQNSFQKDRDETTKSCNEFIENQQKKKDHQQIIF